MGIAFHSEDQHKQRPCDCNKKEKWGNQLGDIKSQTGDGGGLVYDDTRGGGRAVNGLQRDLRSKINRICLLNVGWMG